MNQAGEKKHEKNINGPGKTKRSLSTFDSFFPAQGITKFPRQQKKKISKLHNATAL